MKRYYLCPVIGDGLSPETSFRPKVADIPGLNYVCELPTDPVTGQPLSLWVLCLVSGNKHGQVIADPDVAALPDVALDVKISAIHTATKSKFKDDCSRFGIPTSLVDAADGYRDSIRGIGRLLNPKFDENNFDVAE